jgi:AcrR family transcriptional regulator
LNYKWSDGAMAKTASKAARVSRATGREDGAQTRQQLLETAGIVFAAQGYERATSKEICRRAKANIAAVNYHFGGKEGLYAAVLEEAHARLVSIDLVTLVARQVDDPAAGLRMFLAGIVKEIARKEQGAWELRVLSREMLAPTPMIERMLANQVAPKAKLIGGMIGGMLGLPPTHVAVSRCIVNLMGPCVMLLMVNDQVLGKILPSLKLEPEALVEHLVTFALGGIKAVAAKAKK